MNKIDLDLKSKIPIYIQIRDQLRLMIATGELGEGEQMVPVRDLAHDLLINPNTVSKAYQDLEREGYIHARRGMGTFVSEHKEGTAKEKDTKLAGEITKDFVTRLLELGLTPDEIHKLVDDMLASS